MATSIKISLEFLDELRNDLAKNINRMGVTASNTETLKELIPKVLFITQGNPFTGYFDAEFTKERIMDGDYSTFLYGDEVTLEGAVDVIGYFKMSSCELKLVGTGLDNLQVTVDPSWTKTVNEDGTELKLTRNTNEVGSGGLMTALLEDIKFSAVENVYVTCTFTATEAGTGEIKTATGSTKFTIQKNSWERVEDIYTTWNVLNNYTWNQLENLQV